MAAEACNPNLQAISQFCIVNPAFTIGGERWKIFNADSNGMDELGVIVRIGRRVYYDTNRYFLWIELQNTGELDAVVRLIRAHRERGEYLAPEAAVEALRQSKGTVA